MRTADLTGQDLAYWVARANVKGSRQETNVLRRHYGAGSAGHDSISESAMRAFVESKFGDNLPARDAWH